VTGQSWARKIRSGEKSENVYQQVVGEVAKWAGLRCTFRVIEQYCCSAAILASWVFLANCCPLESALQKYFSSGSLFRHLVRFLRQEEHKLASREISLLKQIAVSFTVSSKMINQREDDLVLHTPHTREAISKAT